MLHQRAFDFERANQMAGRLDDVVGASDEPEIAVRIAFAEAADWEPTEDLLKDVYSPAAAP
jgi:hypothetical protein